MLRSMILAAAGSSKLERIVATAPVSRDVVSRYVAGTNTEDAIVSARELVSSGLKVTLDYLGEDTLTVAQAEDTRDEYLALLAGLKAEGLTQHGEVSVKLSALGQRFDDVLSNDLVEEICEAAAAANTTVTIDMEDHTVTDITLDTVTKLRERYASTGVVLQSYLRRTEADCKEFAGEGSRVRLCKGAYSEPESVAYQQRIDTDLSYVRCVNALMGGDGYPMIATHDPRLIDIAIDRAKWFDRGPHSFEFQMLYGIRPEEQLRLAEAGYQVRVYLPYGDQWWGYLVRRLAERPANLSFFARSLINKR